MSFHRPGCSLPNAFRSLLHQRPIDVCGLGSQRGILNGNVPCALIQPFTKTTTLLWVQHLELLGVNPNPNPTRTGNLHRNLSLPRSLIVQLSCLLAWALTSALEGDHEDRVAMALVTFLDRILTLAKALSSWGPNSNV